MLTSWFLDVEPLPRSHAYSAIGIPDALKGPLNTIGDPLHNILVVNLELFVIGVTGVTLCLDGYPTNNVVIEKKSVSEIEVHGTFI